ncbi:tannase/feruloyl esterase family alpha/beta hydrolase [Hyalangium versicolor]|uniref:tannase/feruloyl esterase family alpha/beta hydrolase n=1 Tax=Hyalangium versicolor TaxID=2861190 RepID=UPI001CCDEACB|nr:tannase/feruloyl esterase family alpha/beta hydrolase [Hyalangium versicolor]
MKAIVRAARAGWTLGLVCLLVACSGDDDTGSPAPEPEPSAAQSCSNLAGKTIGGATISAASIVAAASPVPEYCNVIARIPPKLNFEVRLPSQWNGKLHYNGGGGFNGMMTPPSAEALSKGFADVGSDSGHSADPFTADWALDDQVALVNFASASIPTVTNAAREILKVRYGKDADRA